MKPPANSARGSATPPQGGGGPPNIVFFAPDISDVSTIKRAQAFMDHGYGVTVVGFRRDRYNREYRPQWPCILVGRTRDGRYGQRLLSLFSSLPIVLAHGRTLKAASVIYTRNIDQLLLALIARKIAGSRAPIVYEVLDIPAILVEHGIGSTLLRWLERRALRHVRVLVLSSPGFHRNYYQPVQHYDGAWQLVENRLHPSALRYVDAGRKQPRADEDWRRGYQWVVGYVGLIRGRATFDLITRLAERFSDRVLFKFSGVLTTVDEHRFMRALSRHQNIIYEGAYVNPRDLGAIYPKMDFVWALDLEHVAHNSRWLLPCRFYEAGLFGKPCLAVQDFEVGRLIEQLGVGWTFVEPFEEALAQFFESVTPEEYAEKHARLRALPLDTFIAGDEVADIFRLLGHPPRNQEPQPYKTVAEDAALR